MQLDFELNVYAINCPKNLCHLIQDAVSCPIRAGENFSVSLSFSDRPDDSMSGFAVVMYGNGFDDYLSKNLESTDFLLLNHEYDVTLVEKGVTDIINEPVNDKRLYCAVINLVRRCYYRRRFELRDDMLKSHYDKEHSRQILEMMQTDPLTGMNNKAGMYDNFRKADKSSKSSFYFICLDNFKYISNNYGHEIADRYLQDLSRLIREVLPHSDITRYSENEFFAMLPGNLYEGQVRKAARYIVERISFISGYPDDIIQNCPVFIGVLYDESLNEYIDTIVKKAEVAMIRAKKNNTSRYFVSYGS